VPRGALILIFWGIAESVPTGWGEPVCAAR
jgi:hypothetical protein